MKRVLCLALAGAALLLFPAGATAEFGIAPGFPTVEALDAAGQPYTQAGGHPDRLRISLRFNERGVEADGNAKEFAFDMPPGFLGNPRAVPACPRWIAENPLGVKCPPESQVGKAAVKFRINGSLTEQTPVLYNVEPAPGQLAAMTFWIVGKTIVSMGVRPGDYGVTIRQTNIGQGAPINESTVELWGFPADHVPASKAPRQAFLTLPARCDRGPFGLTVRARSWEQPDVETSAYGDTGLPLSGCEALSFDPSFSFALSETGADSPSGATMAIEMPAGADPEALGSPTIESAVVTMPEGVSVSPGGADRLAVCSDAQLGRGSEAPAACPAASRVGSVELVAPQLEEPLRGDLFLGEGRPGERFRIFVVAAGPGVTVKTVGALRPDPASGRITTTLEDLPELAAGRIAMSFDGGPRALLATPLGCGALTATATFKPHGSAAAVRRTAGAVVDHGAGGGECPRGLPFRPGFESGTTSDRAGKPTELTMTLRRGDGEQLVDRFRTTLPAGIGAALGTVDLCGAAQAAAGACPAASRVGSALGEIGSGSEPARIRGEVFLTGPYRRAPFGMALVFPARLGPFDLGTIVSRAALRLDPQSGQVSVESDPLPRLVEGVSVRFRTIGIDLDRPGFVTNPTGCEPTAITTTIRSVGGESVDSSTPFNVRGCDSLRFAPRFALAYQGRKQVRRGGKPGLRTDVRIPDGGTNLRGLDIALPKSVKLNMKGLGRICARQAALEGRCSKASQVGTASGRSPLSSKLFTGTVHIVQPGDSGPPELWTSLDALGARVDVRGSMYVRGGRLHSSLEALPDVRLSRFTMRLDGGKGGIFRLDRDPCAGPRQQRATVALEGQNRAYRIGPRRIGALRCAG